jgi:DNA-binding GntR family transcriptional regulator
MERARSTAKERSGRIASASIVIVPINRSAHDLFAASPGDRKQGPDGGTTRRGPDPVEEEIYRLITQAIVTKQLRPGSRLKEVALAAQFGVSRSQVRRVFQRLGELNFIEFRLNHGASVRRPSPDEARAVFATRRLVEGETVRLTAARNGPQDFARLYAFVENENRAFKKPSKGLGALSSGFHILLGEMCGNSVLARILNQLVHRGVLIQALYERDGQGTICLVHEHAEIVGLMQKKKVQAAVSAMLRHIDHIEGSLDYDRAGSIDRRLAMSIG